MRIEGLTGIYKKTYLDNDIYRFDYSHYVEGTLDDETGIFYDEFDNEIPFIRDLDFLDSKENLGHHGFVPYEELPNVFDYIEDTDIESYFYAYDLESKSVMLLVNVLTDLESGEKNTIVTEIDLDNIHKKAMSYYMDFVNAKGEAVFRNVYTMSLDGSIEDIIKVVKSGELSLEELNSLYEKYKEPYEDASNVLADCEIVLEELKNGIDNINIDDRDPNFDINDSLEVNKILEMLEKRQLTKEEVEMLRTYFESYKAELEPLILSLEKEIKRISEYIEDEEYDEDEQIKDNSNIVDELFNKGEYNLNDLKKLREVIKEYLVGQDEPLKRLVLELSRMKDKDFEDNVGILLSGDSGVGKTYMVQLIAKYLNLPFIRVDSTDLTVPGYVGKDLEEVLWELYECSGKNKEKAEHGIIFFDEIDKKGSNNKDDISGMGVLNHLLTLLDGADVYACKSTKGFGSSEEVKLNSKHMIIIAAGSFPDVYKSKKRSIGFSDKVDDIDVANKTPSTNVFVEKAMMSSDFMNRLPIRIRLNSLTEKDFEDNFERGKDSPIKWEELSFSKHGVKLSVTPEFIKKASEMSLKEGSGFRGSKGIILTATSDALDDIKDNEGVYSEIVLTEETLDNPLVYKKILK